MSIDSYNIFLGPICLSMRMAWLGLRVCEVMGVCEMMSSTWLGVLVLILDRLIIRLGLISKLSPVSLFYSPCWISLIKAMLLRRLFGSLRGTY